MKYAVVTSGGKQYKVSEGDVITVDRMNGNAEGKYTFPEVLLFADGSTIEIGTPALSHITVAGKVLEHGKGDKIRVAKFKAKARYRRVTGFRASITKIQIETIGSASNKGTKKVVETAKK